MCVWVGGWVGGEDWAGVNKLVVGDEVPRVSHPVRLDIYKSILQEMESAIF